MSQIHFDRAGVERLLEHSKKAEGQRATFTGPVTKPSLLLVGDSGIYLMSNGKPHLPLDPAKNDNHSFVVYARECDPTKSLDWYDAKHRIFGGDDGAETLSVADIEKALLTYEPGAPLILGVTPKSINLISYRPISPASKHKPARKKA